MGSHSSVTQHCFLFARDPEGLSPGLSASKNGEISSMGNSHSEQECLRQYWSRALMDTGMAGQPLGGDFIRTFLSFGIVSVSYLAELKDKIIYIFS